MDLFLGPHHKLSCFFVHSLLPLSFIFLLSFPSFIFGFLFSIITFFSQEFYLVLNLFVLYVIFYSLFISSMLLFLCTSLAFPVLIPRVFVDASTDYCINCVVFHSWCHFPLFCDILNLFSLENRNYLKYNQKLRSLREFSLPDTQGLPT